MKTPSGSEGLPKVGCQRPSSVGHLHSQCSTGWVSPIHNGNIGSAVGFNICMYLVRGLLGGGSVMVRRMRAFAVRNEMSCGGVPAATFTSSPAASLSDMPSLLHHQERNCSIRVSGYLT